MTRVCPLCGAKMEPGPGLGGADNPEVWRCTNRWCVNSLGEECGRLIGMTDTEFRNTLSPEERKEYDACYAKSLAGTFDRLRTDLDALLAAVIHDFRLDRLFTRSERPADPIADIQQKVVEMNRIPVLDRRIVIFCHPTDRPAIDQIVEDLPPWQYRITVSDEIPQGDPDIYVFENPSRGGW